VHLLRQQIYMTKVWQKIFFFLIIRFPNLFFGIPPILNKVLNSLILQGFLFLKLFMTDITSTALFTGKIKLNWDFFLFSWRKILKKNHLPKSR